MGSISSFPFLCLANAALCRLALEWSYGKRIPLHRVPLLVNGDDCTMFGPRIVLNRWPNPVTLRELWTKVTNYAGLTSSQGKTIFSLPHKPIVVINSATFDLIDGSFVERKYVPLGIMMNKPRSGLVGLAQQRGYSDLGDLHRDLYRMSPTSVWERVSAAFIASIRPILDQRPNIPWYCPKDLGGPGLLPTMSKKGKYKIAPHDERLFSAIRDQKLNGYLDTRRPILLAKAKRQWMFHDIVLDSYKKESVQRSRFTQTTYTDPYTFDTIDVDMESEEAVYYRLRVVESLFSHEVKKIFEPLGDQCENGNFDKRARNNCAYVHQLTQKHIKDERFVKLPVLSWEELNQPIPDDTYPVLGSCILNHEEIKEQLDAQMIELQVAIYEAGLSTDSSSDAGSS